MNRVDPDGRADLRTADDKAVLDTPSVMLAIGEAMHKTHWEAKTLNQQIEYGFEITGRGPYSAEKVFTSQKNRHIDFPFAANNKKIILPALTPGGLLLAATFHTHLQAGFLMSNQGVETVIHGESRGDKDTAAASQRPVYVADTRSLIRVDPNGVKHDVLTGGDYINFRDRMLLAYRAQLAMEMLRNLRF